MLAAMPVVILSSAMMGVALTKSSKISQTSYAKAGACAEEALSCIKTVTAFGTQSKELDRYNSALAEARKGGIKGGLYTGISLGITFGAVYGTYALTFWYGGTLVEDGTINTWTGLPYNGGDILTVFFSVLFATFGLGQAMPPIQVFQIGMASANDIYDVIDNIKPNIETPILPNKHDQQEQLISQHTNIQTIIKQFNTLTFTGVSFCYPSRPDVMVLDNISFTIKRGMKVAFVGESGSGKSTVLALLERFYDPNRGMVTLNDIDYRNINNGNPSSIRCLFGYVGQEPILFATSIRNNLTYGINNDNMPTDKEIKEACERANVHKFISSLPNGYDTYCGSSNGNSQISGGQKQRIAIARALLRNPQEIPYFDEPEHAPGRLTATLGTYALKLNVLTGTQLGIFAQLTSTAVGGIIVSFSASPKLAAVMLATLPLVALSGAIDMMISGDGIGSSNKEDSYGQANQIISESVQNLRTLRALTAEIRTRDLFQMLIMKSVKKESKEAVISGFVYGLSSLITLSALALGFWYGATLIDNDGLSFDKMMQSLMGVFLSAMGVGQALAFMKDIKEARTAAHDIFQLLDYESPSGGGKSTVFSLLQRFYDVDNGSISVEGCNINDINISWWRSQCGLVSQEPVLFNLTLEDNVRYGSPSDIPREVMIDVANKAGMSDFAGNKVHWDAPLGPRGGLLSGGQKQRVAIARALIRHPKLIMLDEATSALDSASETIVQKAIDDLTSSTSTTNDKPTSIIIAHRLSTIKKADKIIVISEGRAVEEGNHDELLAKRGVYYNLYTTAQQ
ncbi:(ABC) transporter [Perkinsus chesapeaki]|uniref:(ABC) transporter n=1 Tax=Perkinsus chesapeaki TaxID=330153 RepID=A0A7J6L9U7_PERCH|nr:(ABC) transporter [Perkinsus chesapeaki]